MKKSKLGLDFEKVASAKNLAKSIADDVQKFVDIYTTVTVERTCCRLIGIDGIYADLKESEDGWYLDTNVYDLAASCCIGELSERSVRNRSSSVDFPDFTKGAWKTQPPLGIETVDLSKMGLGLGDVKKDKAALNV